MIIGIDCGNSYVKVGFFEGEKLKNILKFPSGDIQKFRILSELKISSPPIILRDVVSSFFAV